MKIQSPAFEHKGTIPSRYTCDGEDISPPLEISDVPQEAGSLLLIVDDPDAPGRTWVHWTVWNIDPQTTEIPEGRLPQGAIEGVTSFRQTGYGGPCPPSGVHRYFFKLFALDTPIEAPIQTTAEGLMGVAQGHILDQAQLMGRYERSE